MFSKIKKFFRWVLGMPDEDDYVFYDDLKPHSQEYSQELSSWEQDVIGVIQQKMDENGPLPQKVYVTYEDIRNWAVEEGSDYTSYGKIKEALDTLEEKSYIERYKEGNKTVTEVRVPYL